LTTCVRSSLSVATGHSSRY